MREALLPPSPFTEREVRRLRSVSREKSPNWCDGVPAVVSPLAVIPIESSSSANRRWDAGATRSALVASASHRRFALLETSVGISTVKPPLGARPLFFALTPRPSPTPRERGVERVRDAAFSLSPARRERGSGGKGAIPTSEPPAVKIVEPPCFPDLVSGNSVPTSLVDS